MSQEKRWAERMGINVKIKVNSLENARTEDKAVNNGEFEVSVVNISKGGMAFVSSEFLPINSFYDAKVVLWTRDSFNAIIEIVRTETIENEEDGMLYGCKFIGLPASDQFKIDVYQIINEQEA